MPRLSLIFFVLVSALCAVDDDPRIRKILDKHVEALGGWRNWNQVESIRLIGTIERGGQIIDFVIVKKRPNQIRATITMPIPGNENEEVQIIRAHDGENAWTATRLTGAAEIKKEKLDQEAASKLLQDAGVLPKLILFWKTGAELSIRETTKLDGEPVTIIEAKPRDDSSIYTFYISLNTYKTLQYRQEIEEGVSIDTIFDDYEEKQGVLIPRSVIINTEQTGRSKMLIKSIEVGVGIYREYFDGSDLMKQ
ncbi:MAG: hypothetical protein AAF546_03240 [Verrucomicrobiota bacterium]